MSHIVIFKTRLASVMDVLAKTAVAEVCKLVAMVMASSSSVPSLGMSSRFNETVSSGEKLQLMMDSELTVQLASLMELLTQEALEKIGRLAEEASAALLLEKPQGHSESPANRPSCSMGVRVDREYGGEEIEEHSPPTGLMKYGESSAFNEETVLCQSASLGDESTDMVESRDGPHLSQAEKPEIGLANCDSQRGPLMNEETGSIETNAEDPPVTPTKLSSDNKDCHIQETCTTVKTVQKHLKVSTGEEPYSCTLCGRKFGRLSNLKAHRVVHTKEKRFNCTQCGKKFTAKCTLKIHQLIVHEGQKRFRCSHCGKDFDQLEFRAHRVILGWGSPFFCSLLSGTDERRHQFFGLSPDTMRQVIEFIYRCPVPITESNVADLLTAAAMFDIAGLIQACCEFLQAHLSPTTCVGIWRLAGQHSCSDLQNQSNRYILGHYTEVAQASEEFLELSHTELLNIIAADHLNVRVEEIVFESIMRWIGHRPAEREQYLSLLLTKVRLGLMDLDYFCSNLLDNALVRRNVSCDHIIQEGMRALAVFSMDSPQLNFQNSLTCPRLPYAVLLAIGGWSGTAPTNAMESYDGRVDDWVNVTLEQEGPRAYHGAAYLNGFVYCVGGYNGVECLSTVHKYDPVNLSWQEVGPMYDRRNHVSVAVLDGCIYAMGGLDGHSRLNSAERYQPETNQWSLISNMHQRRSDASATTLHGRVYICGGFNGQDCLSSAEFYSPETNQWTEITPMSSPRRGLGVIAYGGEVYVVGGFDGVSQLQSADAYNPRTGTWRPLPDMILPRSNFGIEVLEEQLYVVGGFTTIISNCAECYDAAKNEWRPVSCLAVNRSALSCCVVYDLTNIARYAVPRDGDP
ncbi:hypothetical protein GJAV_G00242480 [Gymnothorax javanicus]|nr:hypothetical protein GJAV_G00242480 [Gymnothorax javanicus]